MTTFPGSPCLHKGAIIELNLDKPLASIIVFQYNPDSMTRTLEPQTMGREASRGVSEALRLSGPPQESISLEIEIDATDQLEKGGVGAEFMGIYPALSALEMLLYPKSVLVNANDILLNLGIIEVVPPEAPLTLLVWGIKRVLPVRLTSFSITEQAFDPDLNPILAKVSLGLRVLNYQDLGLASVGGALFMAHQIAKEVMATIGSVGNITSLPSMF